MGRMANNRATITVTWGYEPHSITLSPRDWAKVKAGEELDIDGKGYHYEGEFFWDYWHFGGGLQGELVVNYGNDSAQGFVGKLNDARIDERPVNSRRKLRPTK
jgi:hypothetical protein